MRILFICNYKPSVGGISGQVEMLQRHLREEGHIADIYSTKGSQFERVLMPLRLKKIAQKYDVIHIHCCSGWGFLPAILGITACKKIGKRTILTYHGGDAGQFFEKHEHLVKRYLSCTNYNIVLSGYLEKVFNKHGINCTIIPNILEFNKDLFLARDFIKPHYICIRSLRPIYNIPCILDAFQIVKSNIPTATLTLVGDGVSRKELEKYVTEKTIKDVSFKGRVSNYEIPAFLSQADVMLSAPIIDNMPVSLLEGFNSGLLVISSNVGGVPYMIKDGKNGLLFESNDSLMLSKKMLYAYSHQEESKKMIANAYKGLDKYSWESVRNKYLSLLFN